MIWRGRSDPEDGSDPPRQQLPDPPSPDTVGRRIESVLDAAERAAAGIREDAEEWARRYAEEAHRKADEAAASRIEELSRLTDELVQRARSVAQQSDQLISALDSAGRRILDTARPGQFSSSPQEAASTQRSGWPQESQHRPSPGNRGWRPAGAWTSREPDAPPPQQEPAPPPIQPSQASTSGNSGSVSEGARLLATQMAVAGGSRDEIAWRLREEFGIQDASAILNEIGI